jgi:hypothetical protein
LGDASAAYLSAYGMLFLKGSIAAARDGKAGVARDLHAEARRVAIRLGPNPNAQWSNFGTANVAVHRVSALADLHEGGRVVEEASRIDPAELNALARERRANHFLDVARGYAQWGKREQAVNFIDRPALEAQTGHPVRYEYKQPETEDVLPPPDAIIVGGASFNTINKWASGISDTLALGILNQAIGLKLPVVVMPFIDSALAAHPAFETSIALLRKTGVTVLLGPEVYEPQAPGAGPQALASYPWKAGVEAVEQRRAPS